MESPAPTELTTFPLQAGDSMVAGFLYGYLREQSYAAALRYGTACGSASAFSKGIADRKTVEELLVQLKEREAC